MTEVAGHNARTFAKITRTTAVYVPGRALTGEEITDHPDLVPARLDGRLAPAPERHLDEVRRLYQDVAKPAVPGPLPWAAPGHDAVDRAVDIEPISCRVKV